MKKASLVSLTSNQKMKVGGYAPGGVSPQTAYPSTLILYCAAERAVDVGSTLRSWRT